MNSTVVKALVAACLLVGVLAFFMFGEKKLEPPSHQDASTEHGVDTQAQKPSADVGQDTQPKVHVEVTLPGTVSTASGQKVPKALVIAYATTAAATGSTEKRGEVHADDFGSFKISVTPGKYRFIARYQGFQDAVIERNVANPVAVNGKIPEVEPLEFVLQQGLTISGYVRDYQNAAIPNASVLAYIERAGKNASPEEQIRVLIQLDEIRNEKAIEAHSDSTGYFQLTGLEPRNYRLKASASGFAPTEKRFVRAGDSDVVILMDVGGRILGRVVGPDGNGIADASVTVYEQAAKDVFIMEAVLKSLKPLSETTSDSSGGFVFDCVGGDAKYRVFAEAGGFQSGFEESIVVDRGVDASIELALAKGNVITGVVYGPDSRPLPDANVKIHLTQSRSKDPRAGLPNDGISTDPDGRFHFDTLEDGEHSIIVSHDFYATHQETHVKPNGAELVIELAEGAAITGVISDEANGQPIPGALVVVRDVGGTTKEGVADANGSYEVRGISIQRKPVAKIVRISADGYATRSDAEDVPIAEGRTIPNVDHQLQKNGIVRGVVHDSLGNPLGGVRINVRRQSSAATPIPVIVGGPGQSLEDGTFVIENVGPGTANFLAGTHESYLETDGEPFDLAPGETLEGLELEMLSGGSISGIVVDEAGTPLEGAVVAVRDDRIGEVNPKILAKRATSAANGSYSIANVDPGAQILVCDLDGYLFAELDNVVVQSGHLTPDVRITLTRGATLSGVVTDSAGNPLNGAQITVIDTSEGVRKVTAKTDSTGFYSFDELGQYPVNIDCERAGYSKERRFEVPVNTANNDFRLAKLGAISGQVVNQYGEPLLSFSVSPKFMDKGRAVPRVRSRTFNSKNAPNGVFEFSNLPPGEYKVVVGCPGFGTNAVEGVIVREDSVTELGRVELREGGKIAGTVIDEAGNPIAGAEIRIMGGNPLLRDSPIIGNGSGQRGGRRGRSGRRTDRDGHFKIDAIDIEGALQIRVSHRNFMTSLYEIPVGTMDAEIVMTKGGVIEGFVYNSSREIRPGVQLLLNGNGQNQRVLSDRKGHFEFVGLPDGTYTIRVSNFGRVGGTGKGGRLAEDPVTAVVRGAVADVLDVIYDGEAMGGGKGGNRGPK